MGCEYAKETADPVRQRKGERKVHMRAKNDTVTARYANPSTA